MNVQPIRPIVPAPTARELYAQSVLAAYDDHASLLHDAEALLAKIDALEAPLPDSIISIWKRFRNQLAGVTGNARALADRRV